MRKYINKALMVVAATTFVACETYDFNQEQYKNEIYLQQNTEGILETQCIDMSAEHTKQGAFINVVVNVGGSQRATTDMPVSLVPTDSMFHVYNKSNFDIDSTRFAKLLPAACYEATNLKGVLKAGQSQLTFPIRLKNLEMLSPDSIYFLNYKIDENASAPVNNKKKQVLVRIHWKNEYASTQTMYDYAYNRCSVIDLVEGKTFRSTNTLRSFPLTPTKVRMTAGNEDFGDYKKAAPQIKEKSIVITVGKQLETDPLKYQITIEPLDKKQMEVIMLTPIGEFDNTFYYNKQEALGGGIATYYKEFRVHYKYRLLKPQEDGTNKPEHYKEVKAKLRYQYNPRAEQL